MVVRLRLRHLEVLHHQKVHNLLRLHQVLHLWEHQHQVLYHKLHLLNQHQVDNKLKLVKCLILQAVQNQPFLYRQFLI